MRAATPAAGYAPNVWVAGHAGEYAIDGRGSGAWMTVRMPKITDITELILCDAPRSLMAARAALEDMRPACAALDAATVDAGDGVEAHQVVVEVE
jgi:hypothetical protein